MRARTASLVRPLAAFDATTFARHAGAIFRAWRRRRRERAELARMTDRELREIGLAPSDRKWVARGAFWKNHPFAAARPRRR